MGEDGLGRDEGGIGLGGTGRGEARRAKRSKYTTLISDTGGKKSSLMMGRTVTSLR